MPDYSVVESIFLKAVEQKTPAELAKFLDANCKDASIRQEVERLVAADPNVGDFLSAPAIPADATVDRIPGEGPGDQIGPYKLMEQIGEGGFGLVYVAEQQRPVRRKVAIKVIKPGMDSKEVLARFEAERQALAIMDHPGIAKVLDGGTTESGRPYFVMELVKGVPITTYCDENKLSVQKRLELFIAVCRAIQHAHQKGVIHRDLKPSNILAADHDNDVVPKVIDFGLAKALHHSLTDRTLYTRFGQLVGTFEYMSPEQAKLNQIDIDTRTDIYSLGTLLYELLTGCTPFDKQTLRDAALDKMLSIIRDVEPPRPSLRLTSEATSSLAAEHRRTDVEKLSSQLRGDLDVIVMKSLDKERSKRYQTALAFAEDVQRFMDDQPIEARAPSPWYRMAKFARRNRVAVMAGTAVAISLLLATIGSAVAWRHWRQTAMERDQLFQQAEEAKGLALGLVSELEENKGELQHRAYVGELNSAYVAWKASDMERADALLNKHVPSAGVRDLRGFEWYWLRDAVDGARRASKRIPSEARYLQTGGSGPLARVLIAGTSGVSVWAANGPFKRSVSNYDFDIATGWYGVTTFSVSPDGRRMAHGMTGADGEANIVLRDVGTGEILSQAQVLPAFREEGNRTREVGFDALSFSRDGKYLAIGIHHGRRIGFVLWNVDSGGILNRHPQSWKGMDEGLFDKWLMDITFDADGQVLATACSDGKLKLWEVSTHECLATLEHDAAVMDSEYLTDHRVVVATADRRIHVWIPVKGSPGNYHEKSFPVTSRVRSIAVSPDEKLLAVGRIDAMVGLHDLDSGRLVHLVRGHTGNVQQVDFVGAKQLATRDNQGTVRVWGVPGYAGMKEVLRFTGGSRTLYSTLEVQAHPNWVSSIAVHPSEPIVASGKNLGKVKVWDALTGRLLGQRDGKGNMMSFSPDGDMLAYWATDLGTEEKTVWGPAVWDWRKDQVTTLPDPKMKKGFGAPFGLTSDAAGTHYYTWCNDDLPGSDLIAYSIQDLGRSPTHTRIDVDVTTLAFVPNSERVVIGSQEGELVLLNTRSGETLWETEDAHEFVTVVEVSPDGSTIASACGQKKTLYVWDTQSGQRLATLHGHSVQAKDAAFSPDGNTLASCGSDGRVILWDTTTWQEQFAFHRPGRGFTCLRFTADGKTLVAGSRSGALTFWNAEWKGVQQSVVARQ